MWRRSNASWQGSDLSDQDDVLLADLLKHPAMSVLMRRVEARKTEDALRLAKKIVEQNYPIDQRSVDETRGFWRGVEWFIRETKRGGHAFDKGVEQ